MPFAQHLKSNEQEKAVVLRGQGSRAASKVEKCEWNTAQATTLFWPRDTLVPDDSLASNPRESLL